MKTITTTTTTMNTNTSFIDIPWSAQKTGQNKDKTSNRSRCGSGSTVKCSNTVFKQLKLVFPKRLKTVDNTHL